MKQSVAVCVLIVAIWSFIATDSHAAKILIVPLNCNSHLLFFSRLGIELAKLGHVITLLAPSNGRVPDIVSDNMENFTYIRYRVNRTTSILNSIELTDNAATKSPLWYLLSMRQRQMDRIRESEQDCTELLDNVEFMRQVRETGFDFAIMDPLSAVACFYTIPLSLEIPYAGLSMPFSPPKLFRVPRLASFPNFFSYSYRPTFFERLQSFVVERINSELFTDNTYFMEKYAPNHTYLSPVEMLQRQSLWFFYEDLSVNYPLPQMPNTVAVGDIMARPSERPLSGEIKEFVSRSKHGVIIVVFGSMRPSFPSTITQRLCEAFKEATERFGLSVIWKLEDQNFCRSDNILISPWIPQNDLLADSRVKLFISHGGYNSVIESVYHAKPLIIFPIRFDQPVNAAAAESKGYAIRMNIVDFSSESLVSNIGKLLTDPTYKRNAQLASDIMRDRRDTPAQRVSTMIDHVLKYGDRHLRTSAFELSTLQFLMIDIFAALAAAAAVGVSCVIACCCCIYRSCRRRHCDSKSYYRFEKSKSQ